MVLQRKTMKRAPERSVILSHRTVDFNSGPNTTIPCDGTLKLELLELKSPALELQKDPSRQSSTTSGTCTLKLFCPAFILGPVHFLMTPLEEIT